MAPADASLRRRHGRSPFITTAVAAAIVVSVSGCSEINPFESAAPASTGADGALTSDVDADDVIFLEAMVGQLGSGQRLASAALDPDSAAADELVQLARHLTDEDATRIDRMRELLADWGRSVPTSSSAVELMDALDGLDDLSGPGFDEQWVGLMLDHHARAILLAEAVQRDGTNRQVNNLASGMLVDLRFEVGRLEAVVSG